mmetsp:Transcript_41107/g.74125  ORF Transcript_41107/g.74125 Transcript_41107/m.74125 type:complete len:264 (+) Transcript_41107:1895-2686(+)
MTFAKEENRARTARPIALLGPTRSNQTTANPVGHGMAPCLTSRLSLTLTFPSRALNTRRTPRRATSAFTTAWGARLAMPRGPTSSPTVGSMRNRLPRAARGITAPSAACRSMFPAGTRWACSLRMTMAATSCTTRTTLASWRMITPWSILARPSTSTSRASMHTASTIHSCSPARSHTRQISPLSARLMAIATMAHSAMGKRHATSEPANPGLPQPALLRTTRAPMLWAPASRAYLRWTAPMATCATASRPATLRGSASRGLR